MTMNYLQAIKIAEDRKAREAKAAAREMISEGGPVATNTPDPEPEQETASPEYPVSHPSASESPSEPSEDDSLESWLAGIRQREARR